VVRRAFILGDLVGQFSACAEVRARLPHKSFPRSGIVRFLGREATPDSSEPSTLLVADFFASKFSRAGHRRESGCLAGKNGRTPLCGHAQEKEDVGVVHQ